MVRTMMSDNKDKPFSVHLIIEGDEEECFFEIVKQFGVKDNIKLTYENAGGSGSIASLYQYARAQEEYDCVLCVYDVDYRQDEKKSPYNNVVYELTLILGKSDLVKKVSFCTNPNILQLLLLGCDSFDKVKLFKSSKKDNTPIVHKYWDKIGRDIDSGFKKSSYYDAKGWQLDIIKNSYIYEESPSYEYNDLYKNCKNVPSDYLSNEPGTNVFKLLESLKEGKTAFFDNINKKLNR